MKGKWSMKAEEYGKIAIKDDCKMFDEKKCDCKALNKLYCRKEKCNFYKPYKNKDQQRKKLL